MRALLSGCSLVVGAVALLVGFGPSQASEPALSPRQAAALACHLADTADLALTAGLSASQTSCTQIVWRDSQPN